MSTKFNIPYSNCDGEKIIQGYVDDLIAFDKHQEYNNVVSIKFIAYLYPSGACLIVIYVDCYRDQYIILISQEYCGLSFKFQISSFKVHVFQKYG